MRFNIVRIVVQPVDGGFVATPSDDTGVVEGCEWYHKDRKEAARRVRHSCVEKLGTCKFTEEHK